MFIVKIAYTLLEATNNLSGKHLEKYYYIYDDFGFLSCKILSEFVKLLHLPLLHFFSNNLFISNNTSYSHLLLQALQYDMLRWYVRLVYTYITKRGGKIKYELKLNKNTHLYILFFCELKNNYEWLHELANVIMKSIFYAWILNMVWINCTFIYQKI